MGYSEQRLMIEFLQIFIIIGLTAWVFAVNLKIPNSKVTLMHKSIELRIACIFLCAFLLIFTFNNYGTSRANNELKFILSGKVELLEINNNPFDNADALVYSLKNMCNPPAHHSHTTNNLQLTIKTDNKLFQLGLQRDSKNPHEYWIFFPAFSRGVIGYICTSALDSF